MSEFLIGKDKLPERAGTQSLKSRVSSLKAKLEKFNKLKGQVLLCDVSGSMSAMVHNDEGGAVQRAIDIVQGVVDHFEGADIYAFHSIVEKCKGTNIGGPRGGTNMYIAFTAMHTHGHKKLTLLTDGAPSCDKNHALRAAQGLTINIIYIGPKPTPDFLIKLGNIQGNTFDEVNLLEARSAERLETKIRGLLGA